MENSNIKKPKRKSPDVKKMVGIAVFSALAFGVTFVFRIPVSFLTFDAKDAVIAVASFIYGPLSAVIISFLAALIEFITISDTGIYGALMNFFASCAFSFTASFIYKFRRTFSGAIIGIYSAVAVTTGVMMVMNIFITPLYMGVDRAAVISLLPKLLLPFNFAKALMNASIVMLIYKPVVTAMRRAGLISTRSIHIEQPTVKESNKGIFNKKAILTLIVGAATLAIAVTIFVILKK